MYLIVLLFYIFLGNAMALDQELAILYGSFNLTISTKTTLLVKAPMGPKTIFFLNFYLILYQN